MLIQMEKYITDPVRESSDPDVNWSNSPSQQTAISAT